MLIIGSGGREHALAWRIAQSPLVSKIITAPGNAGTNLPIAETDAGAIEIIARQRGIDLVIVGPEKPLAAGLVDRLQRSGIPTFGPTQAAAQQALLLFTKNTHPVQQFSETHTTGIDPRPRTPIIRDHSTLLRNG